MRGTGRRARSYLDGVGNRYRSGDRVPPRMEINCRRLATPSHLCKSGIGLIDEIFKSSGASRRIQMIMGPPCARFLLLFKRWPTSSLFLPFFSFPFLRRSSPLVGARHTRRSVRYAPIVCKVRVPVEGLSIDPPRSAYPQPRERQGRVSFLTDLHLDPPRWLNSAVPRSI